MFPQPRKSTIIDAWLAYHISCCIRPGKWNSLWCLGATRPRSSAYRLPCRSHTRTYLGCRFSSRWEMYKKFSSPLKSRIYSKWNSMQQNSQKYFHCEGQYMVQCEEGREEEKKHMFTSYIQHTMHVTWVNRNNLVLNYKLLKKHASSTQHHISLNTTFILVLKKNHKPLFLDPEKEK